MTTISLQAPRTQKIDIGDGLIMRWSTKDDADDVGTLLAEAFRWDPMGPSVPEGTVPGPNELVRASGRRLLRGNSAVMTEYDYALIENTRAQPGDCPLVACASLHAVPGYYGSVRLQYGVPEVIATHPDYRNRGLVRRLLAELIHPASEERGDLIQFIHGIPHFYLQFGYTYALRTGERRTKMPSLDMVPKIASGETELFVLREVTLDDIPYLVRMSTPDKLHRDGTELGLLFDTAYWRYTIYDVYMTKQSIYDGSRQTRIIVDAKSGKDVGITVSSFLGLWQWDVFTLEEGVSFLDAVFPVLRAMIKMAKGRYDCDPDSDNAHSMINHLINGLGPRHPASQILKPLLEPEMFGRLYTRIPSYPCFITKVAPVLDERLAKSAMAGMTGTLCMDFFRKVEGSSSRGLEIKFEHGKIVAADDWIPLTPQEKMLEARRRINGDLSTMKRKEYSARFAPLSFTRLLTGEIDVDQMLEQYGENSVQDPESKLLLSILFPKVQHHFVSLWW
ncbi:hypothetical protein BGZ51_008115 [Haplosporangium sp. Z 767]|nr:hypothetical protein BGZ51_008115 [Haplosporangium sp. Z 767]KAF9180238.1 hypothetical protein BGZ50_006369 [Haplosporangium sp. Z 11]